MAIGSGPAGHGGRAATGTPGPAGLRPVDGAGPPAARWVALSGQGTAPPHPRDAAPLTTGTLMLELARPVAGPCVLLDHRGTGDGPAQGLSVMFDPAEGLGVMQRRGGQLRRHWLPGPLPGGAGALLAFGWSGAPGGHWRLAVLPRDETGAVQETTGPDTMTLSLAEALAIFSGDAGQGTALHPAVEWCGVARGEFPFPPAALIAASARIHTPSGPVPARLLRPGDLVLTTDDGPQPLLAATVLELPHRGSLMPVVLRSGHLPLPRDLVVGPRQHVLIDGAEVEYLFGTDEVFVTARELIDGRLARPVGDGAVTAMAALVLAHPGVLLAEGMALAAGHADPAARSARPCLRGYEAAALRAERGG